ncbi:UNVERIFIED_ORG: hypothetical protein ABIC54_004288 [Burkholderia sp. 1263]|uniref:hypothetical protein n=1 Tax=Paraburkholderia terricola TaxID=169427 RepID=UPI0012602BBC|nr:hypothetical protein [Paraburkholderia terricola]MDR6445568.1 hypothetical protein [Paraburkholderia terricola]
MTLDQLRRELQRGTLCGPDTPALPGVALGGQLACALLEIASRRSTGPRLQLPREQMPVLP